MKPLLFLAAVFLLLTFVGLALWRLSDLRQDRAEVSRLLALQPRAPAPFHPDLVAELPAPVRAYFTAMIAAGTPLHTVARIEMAGRFGIGNNESHRYLPMRAREVLAAPEGFHWAMAVPLGRGGISGSDSGRWTRFWALGLAPVARAGGTDDHRRSAFGRYVAEAVFWSPAALMPGPDVTWEALSDTTLRVAVRHGDLEQTVDVTLSAGGLPETVSLDRWSDANPDATFQLQPFGGTVSAFRDFGGFRLPTQVEAGNFFGTDAYFPFFIAEVTSISFPPAGS